MHGNKSRVNKRFDKVFISPQLNEKLGQHFFIIML